MSERPDWDDYFLGIAEAVSARADCTRAKVGAVIVDAGHRILSTGYNGAPSGYRGCLSGACPRGLRTLAEQPPGGSYDDCIALHAELNAIVYAGRERCLGAILYITRDPCDGCKKVIHAAGLARVRTPTLWWSL